MTNRTNQTTTFIFDFDGTLADTLSHLVQISNQLSKQYNYSLVHEENILALKNKSLHEVAKELNVPLLKIPVIATKARQILSETADQIQAFSGIIDALHYLKQNGFSLGLISSNSENTITSFLKRYNSDFFDFTKTSATLWGKSRYIKHFIKNQKLDPIKTYYVGDEIRDIEAADKSNIKSISVAWGYNSYESLKLKKPTHLIRKPAELIPLVDSF